MLNIVNRLIINIVKYKIGKLLLNYIYRKLYIWKNKTDDTKGAHGHFRIIRIG